MISCMRQADMASAHSKYEDALKQNSMLHEHIAALGAQVKQLRAAESHEGAAGGAGDDGAASADPAGKNLDQLWELVRYERQKTQVRGTGGSSVLYGLASP